ncbi:MAG: enoyl-CoA hydratase/isomerase family protein [Pseudomonadota bacterium]
MTNHVLATEEDGIWTVTLNRPEKANALTSEMLNSLADIAQAAKEAKALVLTGNGKVFSAGADLENVETLATHPGWERLSGHIAAINGLTIAALNGTVAGGSFGMVLACDLRIAVPGTKFFYPVMKMGVLPQPSDPRRMAKLIGPSRTKKILLAAQKIETEAAASWGLVDEIVENEQLMRRAYALTDAMRTANPSHVREIKNTV